MRTAAFNLLAQFPEGPLPGIECAQDIEALLVGTLPLLQSARVYDSEAGASILRLITLRYVGSLGWKVKLSWALPMVDVEVKESAAQGGYQALAASGPTQMRAVQLLLDGALKSVVEGLSAQASRADAPPQSGHVHGFLTTLRWSMADVEAQRERYRDLDIDVKASGLNAIGGWQSRLSAILSACYAAFEGAMAVLCGDSDADVVDGGGGSVADNFLPGSLSAENETEGLGDETPAMATREGKLRIVLAWLAAKEAALCIGQAVALAVPKPAPKGAKLKLAPKHQEKQNQGQLKPEKKQKLDKSRADERPSGAARRGVAEQLGHDGSSNLKDAKAVGCVLSREELNEAGLRLVAVLLQSRHTGVIERAAQGLAFACERLVASPCPALANLPTEWLAALLASALGEPSEELLRLSLQSHRSAHVGRVSPAGAREPTFLRRSAGLPHAVLAVLYAERPGASGGRLFGACMSEALRAAGELSKTEWVQRVHALNLLRMIFLDSAFVLQVMPFAGSGFLAALRALSCRDSWAVRNSGTLLFAALLDRTLRQRRTKEDADATSSDDANGIGVRDFFSRAPELRAFLMDALQPSPDGSSGRGNLAIYPLLLLLSRLVPSPAAAKGSDDAMLDEFVPLVRAFSRDRQLRVRTTAASALVPLVTPDALPAILLELADELCSATSHNHAHGVLLQLRALAAHASTASTFANSFEPRFVGRLCAALVPALVCFTLPCNPVRATFAQLLSTLAPIAPPQSFERAKTAVQEAVLAPVDMSGLDAGAYRAELHRLELQLLCLPLAMASGSAVASQAEAKGSTTGCPLPEAALLRMLASDVYEVRLAGLFAARPLLGLPHAHVDDGVPVVRKAQQQKPPLHGGCSGLLSAISRGELLSSLVAILERSQRSAAWASVETSLGESRSCVLHALYLLVVLLQPSPTGSRCTASPQLRRRLVVANAFCLASRDDEVRAAALELKGAVLCGVGANDAQDTDGSFMRDSEGVATAAAESWEELEGASREDVPVALRISAARAMGTRRPSTAREWQLVLRLLDDDDDDVREAMAAEVTPVVAPGSVGALNATAVQQLAWQFVARRFAKEELGLLLARPKDDVMEIEEEQRLHVNALGTDGNGGRAHQEPFAVFATEACNFYREERQMHDIAAHVLDRSTTTPVGWSASGELLQALQASSHAM